jgi:hypothetical protein
MPTFSRVFRVLFSWRNIRGALVLCAALATFIALFYAEENWRGKHAWREYKREADARGEKLDWPAYIPPKVPDEQNFALTPFLAPLLDFNPQPLKEGQSHWRDTNGYNRIMQFAPELSQTDISKSQPAGQKTDLLECAIMLSNGTNVPSKSMAFTNRTEAAVEVLRKLKSYDPVLDELKTASRRPFSRFNVSYDDENPAGILLPHLAIIRRISRMLEMRASAELEVGRVDDAIDDLNLIFYLADSVRGEPTIVSQLVRVAIIRSFARQIIWEGLAGHRWTDPQLREFQSRLEKIEFIKSMDQSFRAERSGFGTQLFDYCRHHPSEIGNLFDGSAAAEPFAWAPKGWLYQEQISYHHLFGDILLGFDPVAARVDPHGIENNQAAENLALNEGYFSLLWHHRLLSRLLLPALDKAVQKFALAQTDVNLANLACALERYRIANGNFPDSLDALAPKFIPSIPHDVITGEPLKFHLGDNGRFKLYSVGWNEKDDGGAEVTRKSDAELYPLRHLPTHHANSDQGDWVWPQYPAQ